MDPLHFAPAVRPVSVLVEAAPEGVLHDASEYDCTLIVATVPVLSSVAVRIMLPLPVADGKHRLAVNSCCVCIAPVHPVLLNVVLSRYSKVLCGAAGVATSSSANSSRTTDIVRGVSK
jgi:hypothetical protein